MSHTMHSRSTTGLSEQSSLESSYGSVGIQCIAVLHVVADISNSDHETIAFALAFAINRVIEVPRGLAIDGDERQLCDVGAALAVRRAYVARQSCSQTFGRR